MRTRTESETGTASCEDPSVLDSECARLVDECRQGNAEGFGRLVSLTEPRVRRMIGRLVLSRPDVDDLVQETYLRAWKSLGRFRGDSRFSTWLFRIAVNVTRSWRRARPAALPLPGGDTLAARAGAEPGDDALIDAYERALSGLSHDLRTTFLLHETEGLSYQEVAEAIGCPIGTVMSRLHRARQKVLAELRERLEELTP
ncbi:MAG: sigma-70 family RNA polymerase sigma factor [Isosphaeraceae bacterium]|nr:sigma-70 family RNA polymerase sigma factor [Isosphaeraceae bacterium]